MAVALPGRRKPVFRGEMANRHGSLRRLMSRLSAHGERAQQAAETGDETPQPDSAPVTPPAPSDTSTSVATAQDNAVTYNISNVQGDVVIGEDTRAPQTAPPADEPGSEYPPAASPDITDPLRAQICRFEGFTPEAYHDGAAWHIACGHKLSDVEMAALRDEDIEKAEIEARRLFGGRLDDMAPARRDALNWLCFAAACAGFGDVITAVRSDPPNWDIAAEEVTDSEFRNDPRFPGRAPIADCIASWLRTGEYLEC